MRTPDGGPGGAPGGGPGGGAGIGDGPVGGAGVDDGPVGGAGVDDGPVGGGLGSAPVGDGSVGGACGGAVGGGSMGGGGAGGGSGGGSGERPVGGGPVHPVSPGLVLRWSAAGTVGVLGVVLGAYAIYTVRAILVLVLIALFLAVSLDPAVRWLVDRRVPRPAAVALVVLVLLGLFAGFLWSVVPPLVEQGGKLIADLPGYLRTLSERSTAVRDVTDRYHLTDRLNGLLAAAPAMLAGGAVGFVQRFLGLVGSTLTVLVLTIYFMIDMVRLRRGVVRLVPRANRTRVAEVVDIVIDKVGGYMIGNIVISLFAGAASFVCLEAVRVPFALPLAVTVALTDLIPMIGASLGALICVLVAVLTEGVWPAGVVVLAFFILYQQAENYLIAPRVLRGSMDLPSVGVLLAALVGGAVLGLIGALMAIPIAATVRVVVSRALDDADRPAAAPDDRAPSGTD